MKNRILVVIILLHAYQFSCGQNNTGELSRSSFINSHSGIPSYSLPSSAQETTQTAHDEKQESINSEDIIGETVFVNITSSLHGRWIRNENGDNIWQLRINSETNAYLMLIIHDFNLPLGTELFVYSEDYDQVAGPYMSINNMPSGKLTTSPIKGKSIIVELYCPSYVVNYSSLLSISSIGLIYDSEENIFLKSFGDAENCMINVNCDPLVLCDQRRSVAMIIRVSEGNNEIRHCTGSLLANERHDGKPFFLTACHCIDTNNDDIISQDEKNELQSWLFIFNYQSPDCSNPIIEPSLSHAISGATYINSSKSSHTDYALVQLNSRPSKDYNAYYNGWSNKEDDMASAAFCIHHPAGDIKKISFGTKKIIFNQNLWRIGWLLGSTQGGSSGAPLINPDGYVVGQNSKLQGIPCNGNEDALFGKFSRSWHNYSLSWILNPNGIHLGSALYYISRMRGDETCRENWYFPNGDDLHTSDNVSFFNMPSIGTRMYDGVYNAQNSIIAENVTIQSNTSVIFEAGNYVELKHGFSTMNNSTFEAKIGDCLRGCGNNYFQVYDESTDIDTPAMEISTTDNRSEYNNIVLQNENSDYKVEVFPNPNNGTFNILLSTVIDEMIYLQIFNQLGSPVFSMDFSNNRELIVENLPSGLYLLSVFLNDKIITKKIIVSN